MSRAKKCATWFLFAFNVVSMLSGFAAVGYGLWMLFDPARYDKFLGTNQFMYPAAILIGSGLLVILVSFCGCCGALRKSRCLLGIYILMLLLVLGAQVAAGALGFYFKDRVGSSVLNQTDSLIKQKYGTGDRELDYTVDLLQEKLKCCGAVSSDDYQDSQWLLQFPHGKKKVPESCCSKPSLCASETIISLVHKEGCSDKLLSLTVKNLKVLGGIGVGLGSIQVLGVFFSGCLIELLRVQSEVL